MVSKLETQKKLQIEAKLYKQNKIIMDEIYTVYSQSEKTSINMTTNLERLKMLVTSFKRNDSILNKSMSVLSGSVKLNPIVVRGNFVVILLEGMEQGFGFMEPVEELIIFQNTRGGVKR